MARFNEILVGRFNRFLQKWLSMKGGPPSAQLSTEIQPNFNFFSGAENRALESWYLYGTFSSQVAVLAQNSFFQLRNPPKSGVLTVIEAIVVIPGLAGDRCDIQYGQPGADGAQILGNRTRDGRNLGTAGQTKASALTASQGTLAGPQIGTTIFSLASSLAGASVTFPNNENQEIPLSPGDAVRVVEQTVNTALSVGWLWRERVIEDSELTI